MFKSLAFKVLGKIPASFAPVMAAGGAALLCAAYVYSPEPKADTRNFESGVEVNINRTSPAFAALEDTHETFVKSSQDSVSPYLPFTSLVAGVATFEDKAMQIATQNQAILRAQETARLVARRNEDEKTRRLQAFLDSVFAKKEVAHNAEPTPIAGAEALRGTTQAAKTVPALNQADPVGLSDVGPGALIVTNGQIKPLSAAVEVTAPNEVKTVNLAEMKISREDLLKGLILPLMQAQANQPQKPNERVKVGGLTRRAVKDVAPTPDVPASVEKTAARFSPQDSAAGLVADSVDTQSVVDPKTISGTIEFHGGLALTSGKDEVVVYREVDGQRVEWGNVWVRQGRYEIYVADDEGELVAELQNRGIVLGRGEVRLSTVGKSEVAIRIQPIRRGLLGQARSAYSFTGKVEPVANAEVKLAGLDLAAESKESGKFENEDLGAGSVVVTQARRPGYWGTMSFAVSGQPKALTLYPNKMMDAFTSLVGSQDRFASERPPVIWGRVVNNGTPVAGAQVELLTGEREIRAVYFNSLMIPDPALKATSGNGMYAFFPVEPGVQVVQVQMGNDLLEPIVLPTEEGYVSSIDLESRRSHRVSVKVFDAFKTHEPLAAEIQALGSERLHQVNGNGEARIQLAKVHGLMVMDARGDEKYATTRLTIHGEPKSLLVPLVEQAWIGRVEAQASINRNRDTGIAVGFANSQDRYQVFPSSEISTNEIRVVYFDSKGQVLNSTHGVPGGGYIVYNLPEGFTTISLVAEKMAGIQAVTTLMEKNVVNVLHHTIR